MEAIKERVITWCRNGFNIEEGIAIFLSYNRNFFYMNNVRMKPPEEAVQTLKSELFFKTGITLKEMNALNKESSDNSDTDEEFLTGEERQVIEEKKEKNRQENRLRGEFPFLNDKDCPDEFEVIVQEMVTNFYRYKKRHKLMFDIDFRDVDACYEASSGVVEAYLANRFCWDELNYYKLHNQVLGLHPLFEDKARYEQLKKMTSYELTIELTRNIGRNISYHKTMLKKHPKSDKTETWKQKILQYEKEKAWIEKILSDRGEFKK